MMKSSRLPRLAAALFVALTVKVDLSAAQSSVPVWISVLGRETAELCGQAMADALREDNITAPIKIVSPDELKTIRDAGAFGDRVPHAVIFLEARQDLGSLTDIAFAFRDAAHFLAFLQSDFSDEIGRRSSSDQIALAYGGFTQTFSKTVAITEAKHFNGRTVAGDIRALLIYYQFGAKLGADLYGFGLPDLERDFRLMGQDHPLVNIVEAPLAEAINKGAEQSARFLTLSSATIMTISFRDESRREFIPRGRLKRLARTAAMSCSQTIYQRELDALDRFRKSGVRVAPFDRAAMAGASWRKALQEEHNHWTIAEFDQLIQLDGGTRGVPLPSTIVAKLPTAKRRVALKFDEQARKELRQ